MTLKNRSTTMPAAALLAALVLPSVALAAQTTIAISMTAPGSAPRLQAPFTVSAFSNSALVFAIPATGQAPLTYAATGLPSGLSLAANTGIISGTMPSGGTGGTSGGGTSGGGASGSGASSSGGTLGSTGNGSGGTVSGGQATAGSGTAGSASGGSPSAGTTGMTTGGVPTVPGGGSATTAGGGLGSTNTDTSSGCGCRVEVRSTSTAGFGWSCLAALASVTWLRRRRASAKPSA